MNQRNNEKFIVFISTLASIGLIIENLILLDYAILVIFLTGNGTKEAVTRVMELKPDGYLLKTTQKDDLLKFLKDRFRKKNPFM